MASLSGWLGHGQVQCHIALTFLDKYMLYFICDYPMTTCVQLPSFPKQRLLLGFLLPFNSINPEIQDFSSPAHQPRLA